MGFRTARFGSIAIWGIFIASVTHAQAPVGRPVQHFICHTGFTEEQCRSRMVILRRVLDRYHAEQLGEWSWVLVRTVDWIEILSKRGFGSGSPAFTYLPANETFFDEALTARDCIRGLELTQTWNMSVEELLDKAVRHELAHALCRERDEAETGLLEERLRTGKILTCKPRHRE
jgi:hypothetical protein